MTLAVVAILVGWGVLVALFIIGFRDSVAREHEAYLRLARQDSLLQHTYRRTFDAFIAVQVPALSRSPSPSSVVSLRSIFLEIDSASAALRAEFPPSHASSASVGAFLDSVDHFKSTIVDLIQRPSPSSTASRWLQDFRQGKVPESIEHFRRVKDELHRSIIRGQLEEIVAIDQQFESSFPRWALLALVLASSGVILIEFLRRYEQNQLAASRRMAAGAEQFRMLVEQTQDAILIVQDELAVYANSAALRLFEFSTLDELQRSDIFALAGASVRTMLLEKSVGRGPGEELVRAEEVRSMTQQGRMIDLEVSASMIQWDHRSAVQATFRDITGRKMQEREQALLMWEQEALSQIDRRLIGVVDLNRILDSILGHLTNLTKAHWAGVLLREGVSQRFRWRSMVGATMPKLLDDFPLTPRLRAVLGTHEPFVMHEVTTPIEDRLTGLTGIADERILSSVWIPLKGEPEVRGVLAVGYRQTHDFGRRELRLLVSLAEKMSIAAANASLYEDLLARERDLEVLSGLRVNAQEEERRRIAREIHDGLGQILTAIKFNVEILEDSSSLNEDDHRRIADVKTLLDNVMKEAREISYNLMPSVLDDFGLAPALQLLAERFGSQTGVRVTFVAQGLSERLSGPVEIALYRIVQEALTNAVRHGEATLVAIQAFRSGGGVRLTIEDNGRGMNTDQAMAQRVVGSGIGLASMRERVNSFRGELDIESSPGNGTLITVRIPAVSGQPIS